MYTILVVDDEAVQRETLSGFLENQGHQVLTAVNGEKAIETVQAETVDLVITDMRMPGLSGLDLLKQTKQINPDIEVIVITAYGSVENATRAMKTGAADFITKPIDLDQLKITVDKVLEHKQLLSENKRLREMANERLQFGAIISQSPAMQETLSMAARVALSQATVMILGESGTGKELIARAIHHTSPRREKPFVAVNMAALSDNLVESELFGHEKGAFTGADRMRQGRFELADQGTLFIDEVGDIPLQTQTKLLRVLQEQQIERIGSSHPISVDVRVITATHQPLEKLIKEGVFREDLYYRLKVVTLNLPALRERKTDIPLLVEHFREHYSKRNNKDIRHISKQAMDLLIKYDYPGNVRELENIIEQAVVLCRDDTIRVSDMPALIPASDYDTTTGTFKERVQAFEKQLILDALKKADGVQTHAARLLGMSERHLRYKLEKYQLKN
ncbi:MAG: sigma-54 dependent transcriptional regulator [candidate division KSB1 bacterium]|nr:sigma-54 dependent transcriptional regulator [candidate division KSB1 bacterium]